MIERILDNYFLKKLLRKIKDATAGYYIDILYTKGLTKNYIRLYFNYKGEKELINPIRIISLDKRDCFMLLCDGKFIEDFKRRIDDAVKHYKDNI